MLATRPPYLRMLQIHERLSSGACVGLGRFIAQLEVSKRTIKRDIEYLRDRYGAPIEWDRAGRGYRYTGPFEKLPLLSISADEALAVALASKVFQAWDCSPLGAALTSGLEKIASVVGSAVSISSEELDELIVSPPGDRTDDAERAKLGQLIEAASSRREVRFAYRKPHEEQAVRQVRPLHLARLDYQWVLIAFDVRKGAIRKFLITRIEKLELLDLVFEAPSDFDLDEYLAGSLGRHTGETRYEVVLEFDAFAAPYVKEERWRPEREIEELPSGSIRVRMTLNNLVDVRRYVLSWGRHAMALEPVELRSEIMGELFATGTLYDVKTPSND